MEKMAEDFLNTAAGRKFLNRGWLVLDMFNAEELSSLKVLVEQLLPESEQSFYLNIWQQNPSERLNFHNKIEHCIAPARERLLKGFESVVNAVACKKSGDHSGWALHQDDTFVDEQTQFSCSIWCPLQDVDGLNGAMRVWSGSHRIFKDFRSPNIPKPFAGAAEQIERQFMELVPMKAGQALLFDHRILHSSGPNHSERRRMAVVSVLKPVNAEMIYPYYEPATGKLYVHSIHPGFYLNSPLGEFSVRPDEKLYPLLKVLDWSPSAMSWNNILEDSLNNRAV
jgi:hypothetical protein